MFAAAAAKQKIDVEALREKLWRIDLEPIAFKLVHPEDGKGWTIEKTDALIEQYRAFLALSELYPNESIVPSKEIDKVWHTHILDTAKYREDCQAVFGRFVDHFPYSGLRGEEDAQNLRDSFEHTRKLFQFHFSIDPRMSVDVAANCGSGSCSPSCNTAECGGCDRRVELDIKTRPVLNRSV